MFCYYFLSATSRRRSAAGRADSLCSYCVMPVTVFMLFNFILDLFLVVMSLCGVIWRFIICIIYMYKYARVYICRVLTLLK
jgi:hypothetical protein